jgi:predicted membrane-bound spermidine synthase
LLIVVVGLTLLCIIVPLALTTKDVSLRGSGFLFVFFASIGFGFMFVEISQMERLIIFLGHPTYGLSVVLFALLLSSGLGSLLTQKASDYKASAAILRLGLLLCVLVLFGELTPYAVRVFRGEPTMLRILVATTILFPLGVLMGMAFPLGMKIASARFGALTSWLWGVNGATSVCASVLAVVIALNAGISASFWAGFVCYAVAFTAFVLASRESHASVPVPSRVPETPLGGG